MSHRFVLLLLCFLPMAGCGASVPNAGHPQVQGPVGEAPRVETVGTVPGSRPRIKVLSRGTGPVTRAGQVIITNVEILDWQRDRPVLGTYDTEQPTTITLDGKHVASTWTRALLGRHAGSRVLLVAPATEGFGPDHRAPAGVPPSDTLIDVFDIIGGYAPDASAAGSSGSPGSAGGTLGALLGGLLRGLPGGVGGTPTRPSPGGGAPHADAEQVPAGAARGGPGSSGVVSRVIVGGTGARVRPGDTVIVQYVGARRRDGGVFDSSYARGGPNAFDLRPGAVPPGWIAGLSGQRVGGRVLLVVPAAMERGFGATTGGVVVPDTTDAYLIDILGTA